MSLSVLAHLNWVKARPNFISRSWERMPQHVSRKGDYQPGGLQDANQTCSYFEMLESVYAHQYEFPDVINNMAEEWYIADLKQCEEMETLKTKILSKSHEQPPEVFLTIGFNHQVWTIPKVIEIIQRVIDNKFVISGNGVFELFRQNGEHPHVHFVLQHSPMSKSKFLEKIWAIKGIKNVVLKKSFIDYKIATSVHKEYILGIKQQSKMIYVERDKAYRNANDIPHLFYKKL